MLYDVGGVGSDGEHPTTLLKPVKRMLNSAIVRTKGFSWEIVLRICTRNSPRPAVQSGAVRKDKVQGMLTISPPARVVRAGIMLLFV